MNDGLIGFPEALKAAPPLSSSASFSSATGVTLTVSSASCQTITMTAAGQFVTLPSEGAISSGIAFLIFNGGQNVFGVQDAAGNVLTFVPSYGKALLISSQNAAAGGAWIVGNMSDVSPLQTAIVNTPSTISSTTLSQHTVVALTSTTALYIGQSTLSLYAAVLTIGAGGAVTSGSWTSMGSVAAISQLSAFAISSTQVLVCFAGATGGYPTTAVLTVSGNSVSSGAWYQPFGTSPGSSAIGLTVAQLSSNTFVVASVSSSTLYLAVGTIAGTAIGFGTVISPTISSNPSGSPGRIGIAVQSATSASLFIANASSQLTGIMLTISGTTVSAGSQQTIDTTNTIIEVCQASQLTPGQIVVYGGGASSSVVFLVRLSGSTLSELSALPIAGCATSDNNLVVASPTSMKVFLYPSSGTARPMAAQVYVINNVLVLAYTTFLSSTVTMGGSNVKGALLSGTSIIFAFFNSLNSSYPTAATGVFLS